MSLVKIFKMRKLKVDIEHLLIIFYHFLNIVTFLLLDIFFM